MSRQMMPGEYMALALLCYILAGLNIHLWWMRDVFVWINFISIIVLALGGAVFTLMAGGKRRRRNDRNRDKSNHMPEM